MSVQKYLDNTGLAYFWGKLKAYFAPVSHTHTSYAVKHSYTTAANAAKNWYRIANANTSQTDITKPIHAQFILTAYNTSYDAGYYERWFVNAEVFGRTAHIVIFGNTQAPFSQARILYENTVADLDSNDRPAIDIYLNYVLANGTTKIEIEEVYNQGWTFVADGQISASTIPTGFENVTCDALRANGVGRSTYSDYTSYIGLLRSDVTSNITLADNNTYRSKVLNCTGTITVTVPSINSAYSWFVIKNFNTASGVITVHPSTTSVLIDGSNTDIKLQPGEYIVIHSRAANSYSIISDGRRYDRCIVSVSNTNYYPFHRIAYIPLYTGSWNDRGITFLVNKDYQGGGYGIARIIFRTNNTASQEAQCSVQWLCRTSDIAVNAIRVGFVKTAGASYLDVFYYSDGAYNSAVCRVLAHANARNSVGRGFTVVSASTEVGNTTATDPKTSVESYKTIADAGMALHSQAYTDIIAASDVGVVGNAATASAVTWSGVTSKPTTIAGYDITDAKIANGTITLGSNSITPLTSHQTLPTLSKTDSGSGNAVTAISVSDHAITVTKGSTFLTSHQSLSDLGIGNVKNYDQSKAIKSITRSGTTFTYTCLDSTTGTFTQQDNNTIYTFATGDSDGQIKVTPSGGSAQNVDVKGLKSAAYTESSAYAAASHGTHVTFSTANPAANGTASPGGSSTTTVAKSDHVHPLQTTVSGNAGSATKLETARSLTTKLDSTAAVTFDGSAAQDAIPVTGILSVANGGTGRGVYPAESTATDFNTYLDTGDYHVRFTSSCLHPPQVSSSTLDCLLIVRRIGSASGVTVNRRIDQIAYVQNSTVNTDIRIFFRKGFQDASATSTDSWSAWMEIATTAYVDNVIAGIVAESGAGYIRYSNGLQMCFETVTISTGTSTSQIGSSGNSYYGSATVNFPKPFSSPPVVTIGGHDGGSGLYNATVETVTASSVKIEVYGKNSGITCTPGYFAIGQWDNS